MASEQELKNNPLHKEFQNLLDKDFKDRKLSILSRYTSIWDPTLSFESSPSFLNSSIGIIPSILALQSTTMKFLVISVSF